MIVRRYISLLDFGTVSSQFRFYVPFSNLYDCRYITKVGMMNSNVDPTHQFLCHHICTQEVNASIPRMIGSLLFEVIRLIYISLEWLWLISMMCDPFKLGTIEKLFVWVPLDLTRGAKAGIGYLCSMSLCIHVIMKKWFLKEVFIQKCYQYDHPVFDLGYSNISLGMLITALFLILQKSSTSGGSIDHEKSTKRISIIVLLQDVECVFRLYCTNTV